LNEKQPALGFPPLITPDNTNFVAGASTQLARQLLLRPQSWGLNTLYLHGPAHSGKTHLASIWAQRNRAEHLQAAGLVLDEIMARRSPLVVDHLDNGFDERALFQLIEQSRLGEAGPLLLIGQKPVNGLEISLPDLRSRLASATAVAIVQPDDSDLRTLFVELMRRYGVAVDERLIRYVLTRVDRSHAAIYGFAERLNTYALERKRRINLSLAQEMIDD
jgi:chromosomal replication initiation ATPase DnaA